MSHYPTQDGFKDEREEPSEVDYECIADYSSTGMCPCCESELETDTTFDETNGLYAHIQACESCGWESVPLYE